MEGVMGKGSLGGLEPRGRNVAVLGLGAEDQAMVGYERAGARHIFLIARGCL